MNLILIPVYNDWKSLNKLLLKINQTFSKKFLTRVLIVDDFSTVKMSLNKKKFNKIKKIEVLRLNENVGSQKAIAIGLNYLNKKKRDFEYITIMDGDGEDDPTTLKLMFRSAKKYKNSIIVSCRKDRNENIFIKFSYKIHLILTSLFTGHWMSFGNYSCLFYKNLNRLLSDNSIWHAYSAAVKKNTNIHRVYAVRAKRFFGESQVNFLFLVTHSLRIMGVFYKRVFFYSLIYLTLINFFLEDFNIVLSIIVLLFNLLILIALSSSKLKNNSSFNIKKVK